MKTWHKKSPTSLDAGLENQIKNNVYETHKKLPVRFGAIGLTPFPLGGFQMMV